MHKNTIKKIYVIILLTALFLLLSNLKIFSEKAYATYTDSNGIEHLSPGEEATVDDSYKPLYSAQYETEDREGNGMSDWGYTQGEINDLWEAQGKCSDSHGWAYVTIGGQEYYLIATGQFFGVVGDYLIITLENGDTYPCLMGDAKSTGDSDEIHYSYCDSEGRYLGHMYYTNNGEQLNIMEIMVGTANEWTAKADGEKLSLETLGRVTSILNGGNYENYPNGPVGADGITYSLTEGTENSSSGFVENFKNHPVETIIDLLLDGIRVIADGIQMIINCIQNSTLHIDMTMMYSYDDLEDDVGPENNNDGAGNKNAYTDVSGYVSDDSDVDQGQIGIEITDSYYDSDTKIPVITVDYYNFAINDINFLDINYLTGNQNHDAGSPWMVIRTLIAGFIRITFYVAALILITMLIIHGINLAQMSMTGIEDPIKQLSSKTGMNKFITAVAMLVGVIVISSLCIFGTDALCKIIAVDSVNSSGTSSTSEHELPIRVHVASAGYSFSTNFTGYARYLSQIKDVTQYATKAMYVFVYFMFVIFNVMVLSFMLLRLFGIYLLTIYGPITVVMYMFSKDAEPGKIPENYKNWAIYYCAFCLTQLIFALTYRLAIMWMAN